jgi:hypothetical protein
MTALIHQQQGLFCFCFVGEKYKKFPFFKKEKEEERKKIL